MVPSGLVRRFSRDQLRILHDAVMTHSTFRVGRGSSIANLEYSLTVPKEQSPPPSHNETNCVAKGERTDQRMMKTQNESDRMRVLEQVLKLILTFADGRNMHAVRAQGSGLTTYPLHGRPGLRAWVAETSFCRHSKGEAFFIATVSAHVFPFMHPVCLFWAALGLMRASCMMVWVPRAALGR